MRILIFASLVLMATTASAGSIRLLNDSSYKLRAIVRGADGTYLGEMIINPFNASTWNDSYGQYLNRDTDFQEGYSRSKTPYTVIWQCIDGNEFSVCQTVPPGGTVTAQSCMGSRQCRPQQKSSGLRHDQPEGFPSNQEE